MWYNKPEKGVKEEQTILQNGEQQLLGFVSLTEALSLTREQNRENHRKYINPELVKLMGLINFDKLFVRAEGVSVWDEEGHEYLDFLGGYGALNLGHNHPKINAALELV